MKDFAKIIHSEQYGQILCYLEQLVSGNTAVNLAVRIQPANEVNTAIATAEFDTCVEAQGFLDSLTLDIAETMLDSFDWEGVIETTLEENTVPDIVH